VGFFDWTAPLVARYGCRWSQTDAETIVEWLGPLPAKGAAVLDVGGASGALASLVADRTGATVTVLDPTPALIARLPERPDIVGVLGVAERMPLESGSMDALMCTDAFHHFRDHEAFASEAGRVCRPGAKVLVLDLDADRVPRLVVWAERLVGEPAAFLRPDETRDLFARHGVVGACERTQGPSYRFLGTVEGQAR
jgi:ubiquinone/menaquinone biosynthesis C-methylase UbiE